MTGVIGIVRNRCSIQGEPLCKTSEMTTTLTQSTTHIQGKGREVNTSGQRLKDSNTVLNTQNKKQYLIAHQGRRGKVTHECRGRKLPTPHSTRNIHDKGREGSVLGQWSRGRPVTNPPPVPPTDRTSSLASSTTSGGSRKSSPKFSRTYSLPRHKFKQGEQCTHQ